jgi:hypothetical protein
MGANSDGLDELEELSLKVGFRLTDDFSTRFSLDLGVGDFCSHHHLLHVDPFIDSDFGVQDFAGDFEAVFGDSKAGGEGEIVDFSYDHCEDFEWERAFERRLFISTDTLML